MSKLSAIMARLVRFSLRDLALVTAFVGLGSFSAANASEIWLRLWLTVFVTALLLSGFLAAYQGGESRAFHLGFTVVGGLYLLLILSALAAPNYSFSATLISRFLPQTVLEFAYFQVLPLLKDGPVPSPPFNGSYGGGGGLGGGGMGGGGFFAVPDLLGQFGGIGGAAPPVAAPAPPITGRTFYPDLDTFLAVGHCLCGLVVAYLGGLAAQAIYLISRKDESVST